MRFQGRRVVVTGGTGYIGGAVVRDLLAEGAEVTVVARRPDRAPWLAGRPGVRVVRGDVADPATLDFSGHDLVVHGAAWVAFGIPAGKRDAFWRTNVEGTRNVVEAARRAGVRKLVHVSSIAAIGDTAGRVADESTPPSRTHRSFYEATKKAAHDVALGARDLDPVAVMPAVVVGRPRPFADGVVPGMPGPMERVLDAFARGKLRALVSGDRPTSYVHVDDVAEGTLLAALAGSGPLLLTDWDGTVAEFFGELGARLGRRPPRLNVPLPVFRAGLWALQAFYNARGKVPPASTETATSLAADLRYDNAKARALGWKPDLWPKMARDYAP